jgi:hypothetical protein
VDRFSKTCLLLIVILLAVIAMRPAFAPQTVAAAPQSGQQAVPQIEPVAPDTVESRPPVLEHAANAHKYYSVIHANLGNIDRTLYRASLQGFDVVGIATYDNFSTAFASFAIVLAKDDKTLYVD